MKKFFTLLSIAISAQLFGLNAYIMLLHNPGCDNQSGKIYVGVTNVSGSYTLQWSTGASTDTIGGLGAGIYSVTVYDGSGSASDTVELDSFGVGKVEVIHVCDSDEGSITLSNITASWPAQYLWYRNGQMMSNSLPYLQNLDPALYFWKLTDAQGCIDSGYVEIKQSVNPNIQVFLSDSSLCWQQQSQLWFSQGYELYDSWDNVFSSTTDTFVFTNNNVSNQPIPIALKDTLNCLYSLSIPTEYPFVYLQGHPDPIPLYQKGDTVTVNFTPQLNPDPNHTYRWMLDGVLLEESNFSFVVLDTSGFVSVFKENEYGCGWPGWLQATVGIGENERYSVAVFPNPILAGQNIQLKSEDLVNTVELFDLQSRLLYRADEVNSDNFSFVVPVEKGIYFVKVNMEMIKIIIE